MAKQLEKHRLTEELIARLPSPDSGRLEVRDELCRGLRLRITDRGLKTFSVIYKVRGAGGFNPATNRLIAGRARRMTIGTWPERKLKDARDIARKALASATDGVDVVEESIAQHRSRYANNFEGVVRRFIDREAKPSVEAWRNIERVLELHVLPKWGSRPIEDIRRRDVHALLDGLVESDRAGTAREVRKHLHRLFGWALDRELVPANPVYALKRGDLRQHDAGRALSDAELRAVWAAAAEMRYPFGDFARLMILTGQRRSDWAAARWSEIDLGKKQLEVPANRYKGRRVHTVPLAAVAWEIVDNLPRWSGKDPYLFRARGTANAITGFNTFKRRLDEIAIASLRLQAASDDVTLPPFRIHDFRVTCKTRLVDLGIPAEVRDAVVGHAKRGLERIYNKNDYLDEKRSALERYSAHVMAVVST